MNVDEISEIVINFRHKIKAKLPHIILEFHIGSAFTMSGPNVAYQFPLYSSRNHGLSYSSRSLDKANLLNLKIS